ncbi:unnamed protein product [Amoebophrya sp. A120]|nr:unnamed protein product [Amoebophrya sp. A120]|eukprot:GSA120T00017747001.1
MYFVILEKSRSSPARLYCPSQTFNFHVRFDIFVAVAFTTTRHTSRVYQGLMHIRYNFDQKFNMIFFPPLR